MVKASPDLAIKITTDASLKGWGAHCAGTSTQGLWTQEERNLHINALEMKAVSFAVKAFTKNKSQVSVHLRVDNTTTVAYINKMGGTKSLDLIQISKELWEYCLQKQITLTAEHLPGRLNVQADRESRQYKDTSNWMLQKKVFIDITKALGAVQIDLFADRTNAQVKKFISWKPDPEAWDTDAFTVSWYGGVAYAFPPFCLIGRCLAKIRQDKATVIMITPTWQAQPWYTELMSMLVEEPILLPPVPDLITSPMAEAHPLQNHGLVLAAWKVDGDPQKHMIFQKRLEIFSEMQDETVRKQLTRAPGESGVAGVIGNRLIPFRPLWSK